MRDATTGKPVFEERAELAEDGEADPQARDERRDAWGTTLDVDRQTPERGSIDDWIAEYDANPLVNVPVSIFASDVIEPGVRITLPDTDSAPAVEGYHDSEYNGLDIDDALEKWLESAGIVNGEFGHHINDVLKKAVKDRRGRRGTAMIEVVYDDRSEQNRIMGLRPFKVETVTAYTREGKSILLRPGDTNADADFDTTRVGSIGDGTRDTLPETKAGETACYIQYDDIYGTREDDEVRFAQSDVVKIAHDADTAEVFGEPDTATILDRAKAVRQQYSDLDQALKATAYSHWLVQVATSDKSEAQELLKGIDPSNPEKVNVVNYDVDNIEHFGGEVPDINNTLKQEIEYVLSAFPVPIYRIGFEGDINRDVTSEQGDDYHRELTEERESLISNFQEILERKAAEFVENPPDLSATIEPQEDENPLHDEEFDADEFASVMQGLQQAGVMLPPETIIETFLGLDPDEVLDDAGEQPLDEADPRVRESFADATSGELANRYSEGDFVTTPEGDGLVSAVVTEGTVDGMDASESPVYVVAYLDEADHDFYRAGDLNSTDPPDTDVNDPEAKLAEFDIEEAMLSDFDYPPSWRESDTPNRVILLDAWSSMGGQFDCGGSCCMGEIGSRRVCASMKDAVLGTEAWRGGWTD